MAEYLGFFLMENYMQHGYICRLARKTLSFCFLLAAVIAISSQHANAERFAHLTRKANAKAFAKAAAGTLTCTSIKDLSKQRNVLYKNSNLHGGRGRTFLDQDRQLKGVRRLKVSGTDGTVFSCFGLYACDRPFGCRYYQATCGDKLSNAKFAAKARLYGGTTTVYVGKGNGVCYSFNATKSRVGSVRK